LLRRKLESVLLKERMEEEEWIFIFFETFQQFYSKSKSMRVKERDLVLLSETIDKDKQRRPSITLDHFDSE
jgi:hypothetical protein